MIKKHNNLKLFSFMFSLFILISSCKYEDGPAISFRTAENRLKGEYVIEKFEVGGQDLTDSLKKMICYEKIIIRKNETFEAKSASLGCGCYGRCALTSNNTKLIFQVTYPLILIEPLGGLYKNVIWKIERLSDDEIHLTTNYNNTFVKFDLKE